MTWIQNCMTRICTKCYPLLITAIIAGAVVIIARVKCREWKLQSLASWISEHTLANIIFWVSCAISLFFVFALYLSGNDLNKLSSGKDGQSIITGSIAMLGIITAAGALVMKYQDEKRNKADEKRKNRDEQRGEFSAALERLSSESAMSRVAGVHTLVEVADKYEQYREETVRVLCAYLRSDHSKDDPVIESVILESLGSHCASDAEPDCQWSGCGLDLHGATILNPFIFTNCRFAAVNLDNVTFKQDIKFRNCEFESLELKNVDPHKDLLLSDLITKEPYAIQLAEETNTHRFQVVNCQSIWKINIFGTIEKIWLAGNCKIGNVSLWDESKIGSIYVTHTVRIDRFDTQHCTIEKINLQNKSEIKDLLLMDGSTITEIAFQNESQIKGKFTMVPSNKINIDKLTMRDNSKISELCIDDETNLEGVITASGEIGQLTTKGNCGIDCLRIPLKDAIKTFDLQGGHIKTCFKPKDLKINDPHKVVKEFVISPYQSSEPIIS